MQPAGSDPTLGWPSAVAAAEPALASRSPLGPDSVDGGAPTRSVAADGRVAAPFRGALERVTALHRHMIRARIVSARMTLLQRTARIGFHTSAIGDEAAIVGAALATSTADWVFPGAREWYAALARGLPVASYVHHAFGSAHDPAKGHASPDHGPARAVRVVPPSGILGAHLPQAVGVAWAAKIDGASHPDAARIASVVLFGAEVVPTGDFHNAVNFAGVFKAPTVFVGRTRGTQAASAWTDRAAAYGVASARVDGADVLAVLTVVTAALSRAREGKGPTLVEVVSPAIPHGELSDAALAGDAILALGEQDPLERLRRTLRHESLFDGDREAADVAEVRAELDLAIAEAERIGPPSPSTIFDDVYADVPLHLVAQRKTLTAGP